MTSIKIDTKELKVVVEGLWSLPDSDLIELADYGLPVTIVSTSMTYEGHYIKMLYGGSEVIVSAVWNGRHNEVTDIRCFVDKNEVKEISMTVYLAVLKEIAKYYLEKYPVMVASRKEA